jgi:hypothetical protein
LCDADHDQRVVSEQQRDERKTAMKSDDVETIPMDKTCLKRRTTVGKPDPTYLYPMEWSIGAIYGVGAGRGGDRVVRSPPRRLQPLAEPCVPQSAAALRQRDVLSSTNAELNGDQPPCPLLSG